MMDNQSENDVKIVPNVDTNDPTKVWSSLLPTQTHIDLMPSDLFESGEAIPADKVRFVCISDTHSRVEGNKQFVIPEGDVLLHAGDFTDGGLPVKVELFNEFLGRLPHKVKVVIAGNHEMTFDDHMVKTKREFLTEVRGILTEEFENTLASKGLASVRDLLTNCVYLQDAFVQVFGINIYGAPWQPDTGIWGFNCSRGEDILQKWDKIPNNTDIIITHGPPLGHGDTRYDDVKVGCVELLSTIQNRVKPKYHVFGHIHEAYGISRDHQTTFINAATCTIMSKPTNAPVVFDYPLPPGHSKQETLNLIVEQF